MKMTEWHFLEVYPFTSIKVTQINQLIIYSKPLFRKQQKGNLVGYGHTIIHNLKRLLPRAILFLVGLNSSLGVVGLCDCVG